MAQVSITVNGRVYRMACEDGEEDHVLDLGTRFNGAIDELRGALGEIGDQRLMVMAGILMTDRLDDSERRLKRAEQEIRDLKAGRVDSASRFDSLDENFVVNLEAVTERIEAITERLRGGVDGADESGG